MKKAVKPLTRIVPMLSCDNNKWVGVICQGVQYDDGSEGIVIFDVMKGKTKDDIETELDLSMTERPWLTDAQELWGGSIKEPTPLDA